MDLITEQDNNDLVINKTEEISDPRETQEFPLTTEKFAKLQEELVKNEEKVANIEHVIDENLKRQAKLQEEILKNEEKIANVEKAIAENRKRKARCENEEALFVEIDKLWALYDVLQNQLADAQSSPGRAKIDAVVEQLSGLDSGLIEIGELLLKILDKE